MLPAYTQPSQTVGQGVQQTLLLTPLSQSVVDQTSPGQLIDGLNGALEVLISNGAGTCTITVQGSFDGFKTAQNIMIVGVVKLSDSTNGTATSRPVVSGAISVAANTSYVYSIPDAYPFLRFAQANSNSLGQGTDPNVKGCTVQLFAIPS